MTQLTLNGFWSFKDYDLTKAYSQGHHQVLKDHGLESIIESSLGWRQEKETYVLLLTEGTVPIAGIRLVKKVKNAPLPLEKAMNEVGFNIEGLLESLLPHGLFEACALWNSKSFAGFKFPLMLCRIAVSIGPRLNCNSAISLNGFHTYSIPKDQGSKMVNTLGINGEFAYPNPQFKSSLWVQADLENLPNASAECTRLVMKVRNLQKDCMITGLKKTHSFCIKLKLNDIW